MHKMLLRFVMVASVSVLPQIVKAEEPEKAGRPSPEMLFRHLDANHDGVISEDEIPPDAPEPLVALLKAADKKGNMKVSLEEFMAAFKEHPLPGPRCGVPVAPGQQSGNMPPPPFGQQFGNMPPPPPFGQQFGNMPPPPPFGQQFGNMPPPPPFGQQFGNMPPPPPFGQQFGNMPPPPPFGQQFGNMPPPPPFGQQFGNMPPPLFGMPISGMPGMHGGMMAPFASGVPGMGCPPQGPPGPPHGGPLGKEPDFKELFTRFDKNKDGKLTLDEFTEGMKQLHKAMMAHAGPNGPMQGRPMQAPPPIPGRMPQSGPGPWMMGGPTPEWHGPAPCPGGGVCPATRPAAIPSRPRAEKDAKGLDARVKELEAKVKALDAKLEAK